MTFAIPYDGKYDWLIPRAILFVIHGSRAYGTHLPTSDYDFKGVCVPPPRYRDGFIHRFAQAESPKHRAKAETDKDTKGLAGEGVEVAGGEDTPDYVVYGIQKFFALAADCNPNLIEVLWAADESYQVLTPEGEALRAAKDKFLSRKAFYTFRGYAMAQLKRIQTHRKWLLNPPDHQPERSEFGLPERTVIPADQLAAAMSIITKRIDGWEIDYGDLSEASKIYIQEQIALYLTEVSVASTETFMAAGRLVGYSDNFLELLDRERHYNAAARNWQSYQRWKSNRNEARAGLEAQYGYDTKHGGHLVRLMRMCREILTDGHVHVMRPDADELRSIRFGEWSYDRLIGWADTQNTELIEIARKSPLRVSPDMEFLDGLCMEITQSVERRLRGT